MASITRITGRRALTSRRAIALELPEFLLQALEARVADANAGGTPDDQVTIEHFVELGLAESISLAEVALLEQRIPGIGNAVAQWLNEID